MNKIYKGKTKNKRHLEVYLRDKFCIELQQQNIEHYNSSIFRIPLLPYKNLKPAYIVRLRDSEPESLILTILKVYPIKRPLYHSYGYNNGDIFLSKGIVNIDKDLKKYIDKDSNLKYFFEIQNKEVYAEQPELIFNSSEKALEHIKKIYT